MIRRLLRYLHRDCATCYARGFYDAALLSKLRDDNERALRHIRLSDAQMHDLVTLRDRYQGGAS